MVIYLLCGIIALLVVLHYIERKDLYNRIMSRNLSEYSHSAGKTESEPRESAHERAINKWRSGQS